MTPLITETRIEPETRPNQANRPTKRKPERRPIIDRIRLEAERRLTDLQVEVRGAWEPVRQFVSPQVGGSTPHNSTTWSTLPRSILSNLTARQMPSLSDLEKKSYQTVAQQQRVPAQEEKHPEKPPIIPPAVREIPVDIFDLVTAVMTGDSLTEVLAQQAHQIMLDLRSRAHDREQKINASMTRKISRYMIAFINYMLELIKDPSTPRPVLIDPLPVLPG